MKLFFQKIIFSVLLFFPLFAIAAVPSWQIVPSESSLTFTGTQNDAPVTGSFKKFSGDIQFDPNLLNESHVKIVIDMASVAAAYNEVVDSLKQKDWLDIQIFPKAVFESTEIVKTGDKAFQVKGKLTVRDKTLPVVLDVTQVDFSSTKAVMKGSTVLKRTQFGVGQGEWADTNGVKDDVKINFVVSAIKK